MNRILAIIFALGCIVYQAEAMEINPADIKQAYRVRFQDHDLFKALLKNNEIIVSVRTHFNGKIRACKLNHNYEFVGIVSVQAFFQIKKAQEILSNNGKKCLSESQ